MRQHEAKKLAQQFDNDFKPTTQEDTLQVIANLSPDTNTPAVLAQVAKWHEAPRRRGSRHRVIASALRVASGTVAPRAANDNGQQQRRRAA